VILPSRDFDRPTDIAFVCMETFSASGGATAGDGGADAAPPPDAGAIAGPAVLSGRPMRECHPRGFVDPNDKNHHTFAFLPNSASGELSVIDADKWNLVNLDPANSGFNRLPLGVLPSQIAASDDGCRLVTANHGSCDLSFVDPAALLAPTLTRAANAAAMATGAATAPVTAAGTTIVTKVVPKTKSGRALRVLAGEVSFLPMSTSALTGAANLCSGDPQQQWQALATFPSCDLVALIDLPSGVIQKAAYAKKTAGVGVELVPLADDQDPVCPVDCQYPPPDASAADAGDGSAVDASEADAGAPEAGTVEAGAPEVPPPPVDPDTGDVPHVGPGALRPGPIAIIPESGRAYVGLANASFVLAFNIRQDQPMWTEGSSVIQLHEGALGVDRLRLSIDPYKDKTMGADKAGSFVGDDPMLDDQPSLRQFVADRQYLYAIARDGSLRVVQVAHQPETECETNVDFTQYAEGTARQDAMNVACRPVTGPSARRPGAIGPGLRFPAPPVDVAVNDVRPVPPDRSETSVSGAHAWVLTASGSVYLVNIDPVTRRISWVDTVGDSALQANVLQCETPASADCHVEPDPAPNTLRNRGYYGFTPALDPATGPARLDLPPAQSTIGPRIEAIWTLGSKANGTAVTTDWIRTSVFFPDPATVTPQAWLVSWEGNLMANPRFSGQIVRDDASGNLTLHDIGMDFCRLGVQQHDIVTLDGCTSDSQCGLGRKCVLGSNGAQGAGGFPIAGLCLEPTTPRTSCDNLLSTIKRYEVTSARQSALGILPHKDELVRPALRPCAITSGPGADGGADGGPDGGHDGAAPDAGPTAAKDAGADAGKDALTSMVVPSDCVDPADPSTANFQCIAGRCLYPCAKANETAGCRAGRICIAYDRTAPKPGTLAAMGKPDPELCDNHECYCADGPQLDGQGADVISCLGELLPYQVGVGRGFAVTGSGTQLPATGVADASGACVPFPDLDPRVRVRIPMDAHNCAPPIVDNTFDSRCNPNLAPSGCPMIDNAVAASDVLIKKTMAGTTANKLREFLETPNDPNPCMFLGGPNETDIPNSAPQHVHAMFRNRDVQFMLTNLERPPTGIFQIRFDVHGGFQGQFVAIPTTVEVTMPARIVLGPFDYNNPPMGTPGTANPEVPFMFVVDQRRIGRSQGGGPTRGQLLRINPRGLSVTTPAIGDQPLFEDLDHSNHLFPIQ
jgi:hypothetical protein